MWWMGILAMVKKKFINLVDMEKILCDLLEKDKIVYPTILAGVAQILR